MQQPSTMSATKITAATPPTKMTYTQFKILSIDLQSAQRRVRSRIHSHFAAVRSHVYCFRCAHTATQSIQYCWVRARSCADGNVLFLGSIGPVRKVRNLVTHRQNNKSVCEELGHWVALAPSGQSIGHRIRAAYRVMCEVNELPAAIDEKLQLLVCMFVCVIHCGLLSTRL